MVRNDDRSAQRVIEEPKRSALPFLAIGAAAAIVVWSMQQESVPKDSADKAPPGQISQRPQADDPTSAKGDLRTLF